MNHRSLASLFQAMAEVKLALWGGVLGGLFIGFLVTLFFWHGGKMRYEDARKIENELKRTRMIAENPHEFEEKKRAQRKALEALETQVLKPGGQVKAISLITEMAEAFGMTLSNIQPIEISGEALEPLESGKIRLLPIQIEMKSSYFSLAKFFKALREAPLLFRVHEVVMEPQEIMPEMMNVKMVVVTFEENRSPPKIDYKNIL